MDTLGPAFYSAAGKAVGICQGACYAAAALFRKVDQPAQEPPGGLSEASPGKKRRKGDVTSSADANTEAQNANLSPKQPQDSGLPAKETDKEDSRGRANANDAEDAEVHLNIDAPAFEPNAAEPNEPDVAGTTEAVTADPTPAEAFGAPEEALHDDSSVVEDAGPVLAAPPGNDTYAEAVVELEPEEETPEISTAAVVENGAVNGDGSRKKGRNKKRKGGGK